MHPAVSCLWFKKNKIVLMKLIVAPRGFCQLSGFFNLPKNHKAPCCLSKGLCDFKRLYFVEAAHPSKTNG